MEGRKLAAAGRRPRRVRERWPGQGWEGVEMKVTYRPRRGVAKGETGERVGTRQERAETGRWRMGLGGGVGGGGARRLQGRRGERERKEESGEEERGEDPKGREGRRSARLERAGRREDKVSAKDERWRKEAIGSEGRGGSNEAGGWKRENAEERERGAVHGSGRR